MPAEGCLAEAREASGGGPPTRNPASSPRHPTAFNAGAIPGFTWHPCCVAHPETEAWRQDEEEALDETVGEPGYHRLDPPSGPYVQGVRDTDRPHNGPEGCLSEGPGLRYPDDSILHQSRRQGTVTDPPA